MLNILSVRRRGLGHGGAARLGHRAAALLCAGLIGGVVGGFAGMMGGCSQISPRVFGGGSSIELTSAAQTGVVYAPKPIQGVYRRVDASTADVYLTDMDIDTLAHAGKSGNGGEGGGVLHIRLFMQPRAGRTPLDNSACNLSIRQLIIADTSASGGGAMGLYAGGGFVNPSGSIGDATITGEIDGATLRLTRATSRFTDLLGPSTARVRFHVRRDDAAALAIAQRFDTWAASLPMVGAGETP